MCEFDNILGKMKTRHRQYAKNRATFMIVIQEFEQSGNIKNNGFAVQPPACKKYIGNPASSSFTINGLAESLARTSMAKLFQFGSESAL